MKYKLEELESLLQAEVVVAVLPDKNKIVVKGEAIFRENRNGNRLGGHIAVQIYVEDASEADDLWRRFNEPILAGERSQRSLAIGKEIDHSRDVS